jgi:hypothetical protein
MALRKSIAATRLSSDMIMKQAMRWVIEHLATSFCAGEPQEVAAETIWRVPVLLAYPFMVVGEVGELWVDGVSGEVVKHTSVKEMKAAARRLGKERDAEIQAAFVQARDS